MVGKPLCYHASDLGAIPRGGYNNRFPYVLALLGQLSLPSFRGREMKYQIIPGLAPIDHRWWHDRPLSTYDPGLVGRTRVDSLTEPWFNCAQSV